MQLCVIATYGIEWAWLDQVVALWIETCRAVVDLEMVSISLLWADLRVVLATRAQAPDPRRTRAFSSDFSMSVSFSQAIMDKNIKYNFALCQIVLCRNAREVNK